MSVLSYLARLFLHSLRRVLRPNQALPLPRRRRRLFRARSIEFDRTSHTHPGRRLIASMVAACGPNRPSYWTKLTPAGLTAWVAATSLETDKHAACNDTKATEGMKLPDSSALRPVA